MGIVSRVSGGVSEVFGASYYRRHPMEAIGFARARQQLRPNRQSPEQFLAGMGAPSPSELIAAFHARDPMWEQARQRVQEVGISQGGVNYDAGIALYGLMRWLQPKVVVETGVAAGASTAFLLAGLADAGGGELWSIELPPEDVGDTAMADGGVFTWPAFGVGWAIPPTLLEEMQGRWTLVLDDVRVALPRLLEQKPTIDVFIHDDLHTPDQQRWEYDLVWDHLPVGGALLSDDANHAWTRFARAHGHGDRALPNVGGFTGLRKRG